MVEKFEEDEEPVVEKEYYIKGEENVKVETFEVELERKVPSKKKRGRKIPNGVRMREVKWRR